MLTNSAFLPALLVAGLLLSIPKLLSFIRKLRIYLKYCKSHRAFSIEAGQGKYQWLEDPFSQSPNFWLCRYAAIKHVFSRAAIHETDHRAGFDWFHYAGWEIPTFDPRYKHTVRDADQAVHGKLAKSKLNTLLDTVQDIGYSEIDRIKAAVGRDGSTVSLHSLMYRLGYNVNCIGIFGPDLDHISQNASMGMDVDAARKAIHLPGQISAACGSPCRRDHQRRPSLRPPTKAYRCTKSI
ncbi:uncharacterized protein MYCFIDRAFT_170535 [Pseudocercospora fijiensis CIRAD86]|uniref:Uncharacterized protein n=1 Tax=Pseudocercospora fijiensis (strain CIRAD86) TaxID=383855 RepID=N1QCA1_PSEFD|nr:uncharacterized protein MYCFIDRAFT_170535 [Pseudocercospora fijiensis CIRAD86]EME88998.1 hypothetical protein MYCFIDRAFT_170535 [Pseudocercospora fijiensis CIRAD86]